MLLNRAGSPLLVSADVCFSNIKWCLRLALHNGLLCSCLVVGNYKPPQWTLTSWLIIYGTPNKRRFNAL